MYDFQWNTSRRIDEAASGLVSKKTPLLAAKLHQDNWNVSLFLSKGKERTTKEGTEQNEAKRRQSVEDQEWRRDKEAAVRSAV